MCRFYISVACVGVQCPFGSRCRLWNETRTPYCEYSCDVDNGGCGESQCIEVNVSTCTPGQCCSPVNVTCQKGMLYVCMHCYNKFLASK